MMLRMAWRSLITRPVRTAVLAAGFGFGIAVMAELLGVGHVMVEQAHAPALQGGGDVVVFGALGRIPSARFIATGFQTAADLSGRIRTVSPSKDARLFLMTRRGAIPVTARGGIPSLEKALGDPEVANIDSWSDTPADVRWSHPDPGDVLRAMDRFHPIPDVPARQSSWAEWLYFNGRTADGRLRFYLTFLVGPYSASPGKRVAAVHLQLQRGGRSSNYSARGEIDEATLLATAPDLQIGGSRVQLDGLSYRITLALDADRKGAGSERISGDIVLDSAPGRSLPPTAIRGANGWVSGYTVPALAGAFSGTLRTSKETVAIGGATGYHDHNWGFWDGVSWQWGQVASDDLSIVFGQVFPPPDAADETRIPGFMAVLGPRGPLGFATDVVIDDHDLPRIEVRARGRGVDLRLTFMVEETTRTSRMMARRPSGPPMDFLQLGGVYHARGRVGDRNVDFTARGSAETFRQH